MSVRETDAAVRLFLGNHFLAAERQMAAHADESFYHSLGHATVLFIKAMMSFEKTDMERAMDAVRRGCALVEQFRPKNSLAESFLSFINPSRAQREITDEEMHAELCYAELLVIRALLTFFIDETLGGFIKGAFRIRMCYQSFKECHRMLRSIPPCHLSACPSSNPSLRRQFEAGIRAGFGLFNVMLSAMPTRVSALLQLVGFSGDRDFGMSELVSVCPFFLPFECRFFQQSASMADTLRAPLAAMVLISYQLFLAHLLDGCPPDLALCSQLLAPLVRQFPNGAVVLFLRARFHLVNGELDRAIQLNNRSIQSQNVYKQFQHICHWELVTVHMVLMHWNRAAWHAKKLLEENQWSKCVYTYLLAILVNADRTAQKRQQAVRQLMQKVGSLRRRIAGRSIPMEKFCEQRANKCLRDDGEMFLPQFEFLYFCNGFTVLDRAPHFVRPLLAHVDAEWTRWRGDERAPRLDSDALVETRAMYAFVRGLCMRALGEHEKARHCFMATIEKVEKRFSTFFSHAENSHG
ncbi:hypothetical protein niasHT_007131 [Heterodera trifolii]|uniref:Tetratricopeptide repeat protein 39B n=1 Tax=Heterodera trifolii TaxID=157864 RepID=A0ABD2LKS3_9BILA